MHNARRLHDDIPHSELILEPGVGHMAHYAAPGHIVDAVARLEASLANAAGMHQPPGALL
ncbi:hypothetical protein LP419_35720 [Massilia sp. H-1]|nr:hypothetical protein LP419_35720 [Massilia sp. H-1]